MKDTLRFRVLLPVFLLAPVVYVLIGYLLIPAAGLFAPGDSPPILPRVLLLTGVAAFLMPFVVERIFIRGYAAKLQARGEDPSFTLFIIGAACFETLTLLALLHCILGHGRDWLPACAVFSIGMIAFWSRRASGWPTGGGPGRP